MSSSTPWYDLHRYATFQQWSSRKSTCIAPTLKDGNRRCYVGINVLEALEWKEMAESLPPGAKRDSALRNLIISLCCNLVHRQKVEIDKNGVLTRLASSYGQHLLAASRTVVKIEDISPRPVYEVQPVVVTQRVKREFESPVPFRHRDVETNTVRDEIIRDVGITYQELGHVYCATCPEFPGFVKIGYTASSAASRVADQDRCFPGIKLEACFHFAFPEKIERLLHRQLLHCRHEIVACEVCERGHIEWFKMSASEAIETLSTWYQLTQKAPLYGLDRKLRTDWSLKICNIPGNISAVALLGTFAVDKAEVLNNIETITGNAESSTISRMTELLSEIRNLREELKAARLDKEAVEKPTQVSDYETEPLTARASTEADRDIVDIPPSQSKPDELAIDRVAEQADATKSFVSLAQHRATQSRSADAVSSRQNIEKAADTITTPVKAAARPQCLPLTPPTTVKKSTTVAITSETPPRLPLGHPSMRKTWTPPSPRSTASLRSHSPEPESDLIDRKSPPSGATKLLSPISISATASTTQAPFKFDKSFSDFASVSQRPLARKPFTFDLYTPKTGMDAREEHGSRSKRPTRRTLPCRPQRKVNLSNGLPNFFKDTTSTGLFDFTRSASSMAIMENTAAKSENEITKVFELKSKQAENKAVAGEQNVASINAVDHVSESRAAEAKSTLIPTNAGATQGLAHANPMPNPLGPDVDQTLAFFSDFMALLATASDLVTLPDVPKDIGPSTSAVLNAVPAPATLGVPAVRAIRAVPLAPMANA